MTTPPFDPQPCGTGGAGDAGADVEQSLLCDVGPDGEILGTALAVYEYDGDGNPAGTPTFVDPTTGAAYVAQGVLQPCPGDVGCSAPVQFCFTSTSTGPVEHPGRIYDITLPVNPGFAVDSLQLDATNYPANITWAVTDPDGAQFASALQSFLAARFSGETVTVTNPNAGTPVCGLATPMTIHIECARIDAGAPDLVELIYNGGRDLVVNPAYLTTPPTNLNGPQFVYLNRQDAGGTLNCTNVANQGWETNDGPPGGADFELWGQGPGGLQTTEAATPTPRGTPIQEITADFPAGSNPPTIWQTFTVPAAGTLKAVLVHGARDNGEQHRITLSTGDTDDNQVGDIINNVTNPPQVTNAGGGTPGAWTTFSQDVALGAGTYTFAISTTNPVGANRGGLFTDMRVYVDAPAQHATAVTDDETCTITTEETTTTTTCEYWQPRCSNGEITGWVNVADGQELDNTAFWAQVPAPSCCLPEAGDGGGGSVTAGNLVHNYEVCGVVGGIAQTLQRIVITDQSGGVIGQTFVGVDGGPVTPSSFTIGGCGGGSFEDAVICYRVNGDPVSRTGFRRERRAADGTSVIEFIGDNGAAVVPEYWRPGECVADTELIPLCDSGTNPPTPYLRRIVFNLEGFPTSAEDVDYFGLPYTLTGDSVTCGAEPVATTGLCLGDGTPIAVVVRREPSGTIVQDGWVNLTTGAFTVGNPPVGTVACGESRSVQISGTFCDVDGNGDVLALVLIEYSYNPDGSIESVRLVDATTGTTYVPVGTITTCPVGTPAPDGDVEVLCDVNAGVATPFIRDYRRDENGVITALANYTLAGAPYTPTGTVGLCQPDDNPVRDEELLVLCDATPTRFLRRYNYDAATGALIGIVNTTLDGSTPFVPVGAVGVCTTAIASDFDFLSTVLCDANGTQFIQRLTFNSSTGAVTATTNTTLTGGAFAPVGAVALCSNCCPQVIGEGCTNTGSGRYTAVRAVNGTVTLIDSVSGATVLPAAIIACPSDDTVRTLNAQARVLTNATPWTPGADVTGTLTSLTVTGTSGLWDLVDQNGTALTGLPAGLSLTWSAADDNTLNGPTSVTPQAGATVVANWTQR